MKIILVFFSLLLTTKCLADSHNVELIFSGEMKVKSVVVNKDKFQVIDLDGITSITKSSFSIFPVNSLTARKCVIYNKNENGKASLEGTCLGEDSDGDTFSTTLSRKGMIGKTGSGGVETYIGLTGKYSGLTGKCDYTVKFINTDKLFAVAYNKCNLVK